VSSADLPRTKAVLGQVGLGKVSGAGGLGPKLSQVVWGELSRQVGNRMRMKGLKVIFWSSTAFTEIAELLWTESHNLVKRSSPNSIVSSEILQLVHLT